MPDWLFAVVANVDKSAVSVEIPGKGACQC